MSQQQRVYAVKVGPDWVEMRLAPRPPKPIRSTVRVETKRLVYAPHQHNYQNGAYIEKPYTYQLRVVAHEGGERLCIIPARKLRDICNNLQVKMVWRQELARVPKRLGELALAPGWRSVNAKP